MLASGVAVTFVVAVVRCSVGLGIGIGIGIDIGTDIAMDWDSNQQEFSLLKSLYRHEGCDR